MRQSVLLGSRRRRISAVAVGAGVSALTALGAVPAATAAAQTVTLSTCNAGDLVKAIDAVNATGGTVELKPGCTYTLTAVNNTDPGIGGANGLPRINNTVRINGHGDTITRAANAPRFRIFQVGQFFFGRGELTLDGLTVRNGRESTGAGIYVLRGNLTTSNTTITDNAATSGGGGVNNVGPGTTWTGTNTRIVGNTAEGGGGGILNGGDLNLTHSQVMRNTAGRDGGGISNEAAAITALHFTPVTDNRAGREGGGIWNGVFFPPGRVTLDHSPVQGNRPDQCVGVPGC